MHILLIHQAFAAPDDPGGTRHYELASWLVARGHRVTVITSAVSYLTGTAAAAERAPLPRGLNVIRVRGLADIHRSFGARAWAFLAFAWAALRAASHVKGVDVVWGTSPPLVQLLPAWLASLRVSGGLLFEERDLWPEFAVGMGIVRDGTLARAALAFKRFIYARARLVVVNSPGFVPFLADYGVPASKLRVIPNGVDPAQFDPQACGKAVRRELAAEDRFIVVYAGALGPANGLDVALEAAQALRDTRALFVFVGDGKARAELMERARGLENVRFVAARPKRAMSELLAAADACLATLRDIPLFRTTYPNKVFDYMAAGRPVLLAIDGVIREVVEQAGAGVFVSPGDAGALAAATRDLMADPAKARAMGLCGRAAVCASFDRRVHAAQLEALLDELAGGRRARDRHAGLDAAARRLLDVAGAGVLLVILVPVLFAVTLAVRLTLGAPVLFRQRRIGLHGRSFMLYKFRTLRAGEPGESDEARLTRVGRVLRRLSIDELPQLWNVVRGDMALVGPRPLLPAYLERYTPRQARRHEVRPGLTGVVQVLGRNRLSWREKFARDVWYVDNRSLVIDLWVLWRTLAVVVRGDGVSAPGRVTMPEFLGRATYQAERVECRSLRSGPVRSGLPDAEGQAVTGHSSSISTIFNA